MPQVNSMDEGDRDTNRHSRPRWLAWIACAAGVLLPCIGFTQTVDPNLWVTNGGVQSTVVVGQTLYLGGDFTLVGPSTGAAVPLDPVTATPVAGFPRVAGRVFAIREDGAGGWYIGGRFSTVGGLQRLNLAHVNPDLSVSAWNPNSNFTQYVGVLGEVRAIAVSGNTVYVGGGFGQIGTEVRHSIAAIDATTGAVTSWDPDCNGFVLAMVLSGSALYVAGDYNHIGGATRERISALDVVTGLASAWNPNANQTVLCLALN